MTAEVFPSKEMMTPYALPADPERVAIATRLVSRCAELLGEEKFYAVLREMWWDDNLYYDSAGNLQLGLTDLQTVAFAAALVVFIKSGAEWDGTMAWAGRLLPQDRGSV